MVRTDNSGNALWARWANWLVGISAGVFLTIGFGGYFYQRGQLADIAAEHLRLMVTGPAQLNAGTPCRFTVKTTTVTGHPVPAQVEFSLSGPDGRQLIAYHENSDQDGLIEIAVAPDVLIPPEIRLDVTGVYLAKTEKVQTRIRVAPVDLLTSLCVSDSSYRPGDTIRFRSLTVSRYSLAGDREVPVRFEIRTAGGSPVAGSVRDGMTVDGAGWGEFTVPAGLAAGKYALTATSLDGRFPETRRDFTIEVDRLASPKVGATKASGQHAAGSKQGAIQVGFFPEGGQLVAGLENRIYFAARDGSGKPIHLSGRVVGRKERVAAQVETTYEGMGVFQLEPQPTEPYALKIDTPSGVSQQISLPPAVANHGVVLTAGLGVLDSGKSLEFNVRATAPGLPLVAVVSCRGIQVGEQILVTGEGANSVSIPLGDDAAGLLRLAVYEYRTKSPVLLGERLVFRRPRKQLQVRVAPAATAYRPGDRAELSLRIADEQGQPAAAAISIAVAGKDKRAVEEPGQIPAASQLLLTDGPTGPIASGDSEFCLSADPKAALALDLILGTRVRPKGTGGEGSEASNRGEQKPDDPSKAVEAGPLPPIMFDNLGHLQRQYQESLTSYRANRTRVLNTLTAMSFFGGIGLVVFVAMLSLLNIPCGLRLWIPSLGVAAACVVIGAILMDPGRLKPNQGGGVPFLSVESLPPAVDEATLPPKRATKDTPANLKPFVDSGYAYHADRKEAAVNPAGTRTLLWRPLMKIDGQGQSTIRLELPSSPGVFRVSVDAHDKFGRLGEGTTTLESGKSP
jgi:hypothetical protein